MSNNAQHADIDVLSNAGDTERRTKCQIDNPGRNANSVALNAKALLAAGLLLPAAMKDSLEWLLVAGAWLIALVSLGLKRISDWGPSARSET